MDKRKGKRLLKAAYKKWQTAMENPDHDSRDGSVYICDCIDYACSDLGTVYSKVEGEFLAYIRARIQGAFSVHQYLIGDTSGMVGDNYPSPDNEDVIQFRIQLWKELFAIVGETSWNP